MKDESGKHKYLDDDTLKHVLNILRKGTVTWSGRTEALKKSRKLVKEGNGRKKFYWQCAKCSCFKRDIKDVEVDHIVEVGPFCGDLDRYICRMYCGQENLQVLCLSCHSKKTVTYNAALKFQRREKTKEFKDEELA